MYKGKFNQKGNSTDIEDLLAQRQADIQAAAAKKAANASKAAAPKGPVRNRPVDNGAASKVFPLEAVPQTASAAKAPKASAPAVAGTSASAPNPEKPAPASSSTAPKISAPKAPAKNDLAADVPAFMAPIPSQRPASKSAPRPNPSTARQPDSSAKKKKKKRGPRLGGVIFYTVYFLFIFLFFVGTLIGMQYVRRWLVSYEAAQPNAKAEQVFTQLFTDPDWEALYVASGAKDSPYEGKDAFVQYMNSKNLDLSQLTYLETSAGLSGNKKFVVRSGSERVATFTLADRNASGRRDLTAIPDWQLDSVEVFFQRDGIYRIEKLQGQTAVVNGVTLTDDFTIQEATTVAQDYLPPEAAIPVTCVQEVTGLMLVPTVRIYNSDGTPAELSYNADTQTFSVNTQASAIGQEEQAAAIAAAEASCKWMIRELTSRDTLAKSFDPNGNAYKTIVSAVVTWTQKNNGYTFLNETVSDYVRYTDNLFSARVSLTLEVKVAIDGSTKTIDFAQSMFFRKDGSGLWRCFEAVNRNVSQPVGKIRLTFKQDETTLLSTFFQTNSSELITPVITPPDGKVFSGWVRKDQDANGRTTLTVVFQPDESGKVAIPEGTVLTPMTLYALFEDAPAYNG